MLKVTFYCFSTILNKGFVNVEYHKSIDNARSRALALNWTIQSIEQIEHGVNDWVIETRAGQVYFAQTATDARLLAELIKTGVGH
jgi:hypothetical protein